MDTPLSVSRETGIDFPKHLASPDPWPSDLQVRSREWWRHRSLNPCSQGTGRECTVIMLHAINSIMWETRKPVGRLVGLKMKIETTSKLCHRRNYSTFVCFMKYSQGAYFESYAGVNGVWWLFSSILIYICQQTYFFFSLVSEALIDQEQSMLYEPLGQLREVREVVRNVLKPGDKNTFPIIFLTVRPTPHCVVKEAHKVQDQCKSKCYFSLPPCLPPPCTLLRCPFTAMPHGSGSPPSLSSSGDNIMLYILWKGTLLWDVGKTQ